MKNGSNNLIASIDSDVEVSKTWLKDLNETINNFNSSMSGCKLIEKLKNEIYIICGDMYSTEFLWRS